MMSNADLSRRDLIAAAVTLVAAVPAQGVLADEQAAPLAKGDAGPKTVMAGLGKAAPADPSQDFVGPGARTSAAAEELDRLVVTRMKSNAGLSYERAFTTEYLAPANRSLKQRVDAESTLRAQAREPAPAFPAYTRG
jgi:hypothetical protein